MIVSTFAGLKQIAEEGISGEQFDKVVTYMHKRHNDLLRSNAYWMQVIQENNTYIWITIPTTIARLMLSHQLIYSNVHVRSWHRPATLRLS